MKKTRNSRLCRAFHFLSALHLRMTGFWTGGLDFSSTKPRKFGPYRQVFRNCQQNVKPSDFIFLGFPATLALFWCKKNKFDWTEQYAEYGRTQQALTIFRSIFTSTESMKEDSFASRPLGQKYSFVKKIQFNSTQPTIQKINITTSLLSGRSPV